MCGVQKAAESYRTIPIPCKTALVLEFAVEACLLKNCSLVSCACSEGPVLGHNILMMMMMMDIDKLKRYFYLAYAPHRLLNDQEMH